MNNKTVTFQIKFKEKVLGKFRTNLPATDDIQAFDKATKFGEANLNVSIMSIDDTRLDEEQYFEEHQKDISEMSSEEQIEYFTTNFDELFNKIQSTTESLCEAETVIEMTLKIPKLDELGMAVLKFSRLVKELKRTIQ